jgi:hypothetical protein
MDLFLSQSDECVAVMVERLHDGGIDLCIHREATEEHILFP